MTLMDEQSGVGRKIEPLDGEARRFDRSRLAEIVSAMEEIATADVSPLDRPSRSGLDERERGSARTSRR